MAKGGFKRFLSFITLLAILIAIDLCWIGIIASNFYKEEFGNLMLPEIRIIPAIIVWLLIAAGIKRFVIPMSQNKGDAAINGGVFGIVSYGIYDLTNYATIQGWTLKLVLVDAFWGMVLCSVVSVIGFYLKNKIFKA